MTENSTRGVIEDNEGSIWYATNGGGLIRMKGDQFKYISVKDGLPSDRVTTLFLDTKGRIWITTENKISSYFNEHLIVYDDDLGTLSIPGIVRTAEDDNGNIWVASSRGLKKIVDGKITTAFTTSNGLLSNVVTTLRAGKEGTLLIGTNNGLNQIKNGVLYNKQLKGLPSKLITSILEDSDGNLWIGTNNGLCIISGETLSVFKQQDGLTGNLVTGIIEAEDRSIWVSTGNGLDQFFKPKFATLNDGSGQDYMQSVVQDSQGTIWFSKIQGLSRFKGGKLKNYITEAIPSTEELYGMYVDKKGDIWVCGLYNVYRYHKGQWDNLKESNGTTFGARGLCIDLENNIWVAASSNKGVKRFANGKWTTFTTADGLPTNKTSGVVCDSRGTIWISTSAGLVKYKDGKFKTITTKDGLPNDYVYYIYEDSEGIIWIGTRGGLAKIQNEKIDAFTTQEGLPDEVIAPIVEDDQNNLWIGCDRGVFRVGKEDLKAVADGKINTVHVNLFNRIDGIKSGWVRGSFIPSALRSKDGSLWFVSPGGAVTITREDMNSDEAAAQVYIESVSLDEKKIQIHFDGENYFPAGSGNLTFQFTALSYKAPHRIQFKYYLKGYDNKWVNAGSRREAFYTNLSPGKYVFKVIAANSEGLWNTEAASLNFYLAPHWYQTWQFIGLIILFAGLLITGLFRLRVRKLRRRQRLLHEQNRELKEHQLALSLSEERYRILYNDNPSMYFTLDEKGIVLSVNRFGAEQLGYEPDELIGKPVHLVFYKDDREGVSEQISELLANPSRVGHLVFRKIRKNGSVLWVQEYARVIKGPKGLNILIVCQDITENKKAEEELFQSGQMLRSILDTIPQRVFWKDRNLVFMGCNKTHAEACGYNEPAEIIGKTDYETTSAGMADIYRADDMKVIETGKPKLNFEEYNIRPDGSRGWLITSKLPLYDINGNINGVLGTYEDITDRKHAEEKLRESEDKFRSLAEQSPNMIFINFRGRIIYANTKCTEVAGYTKEEFYSPEFNFMQLVAEDEIEKIKEYFNKHLQGKEVLPFEYTLITKDKKKLSTILTTKLIPYKDNKAILGIITDISELKRAEKVQNAVYQISQAADRTKNLNDLFKSVHEIITTVMAASNFYIALYDEKNNLMNFPYFVDEVDVTPPPGSPDKGLTYYVLRTAAPLLCDQKTGKELNKLGEIELIGGDSLIWLGAPLIAGNKTIGVMAVQHYSDPKAYNENDLRMFEYVSSQVAKAIERKLKEEEIIEAKERAEASDKLKSEFLAQMSHEIRTPINTIFNFTQLLKEELSFDKNSEQNQYFQTIEKSGERIIRTINLILNMSEIQAGSYRCQYKKINLIKDIFTKIHTEFAYKAKKKNIELILNKTENDFAITADQYSLEQIFVNLIDNAIKYTNEGKIEISTYKNKEKKVCVKIADTGIGISQEYMYNLFKPFSQEEQGYSRKYDGSGLGLSLVKKYCEMNNAEIKVTSNKGKGTEFLLIFNRIKKRNNQTA